MDSLGLKILVVPLNTIIKIFSDQNFSILQFFFQDEGYQPIPGLIPATLRHFIISSRGIEGGRFRRYVDDSPYIEIFQGSSSFELG